MIIMNEHSNTCFETLYIKLRELFSKNKLPFTAALIFGLCAHGYALTNKLLNHDEIASVFGKGATVTSGRWGLALARFIFPDWSMPWICGLVTLLLMSASACVIIRILDIKSPVFQILTSALILTFPSLTGTMCFMFTAAPYALAFLMAMCAVWFYLRGGKADLAAALLLLILALGIYQAYISVVACLFVLLMISDCLDGSKGVKEIVLFGLKALAFMGLSIALYFGIAKLALLIYGSGFNAYVAENVNAQVSPLRRLRIAYDSFGYYFIYRNFYLIPTEASRYMHIVLLFFIVCGAAFAAVKKRRPVHALLLAILLLILPLAINCMYLIMSASAIHTLVIYSFVSLYLLALIVCRNLNCNLSNIYKDLIALMLCITAAVNICFANMCYLKMDIEYKNAASFYTSLIAQIKQTEGFDENCRIALIGEQHNTLNTMPEMDTADMMGPAFDLINVYSRKDFIRIYMDFDVPFADADEVEALVNDYRVQAMPYYPYYGSVAKIDNYIVVNFG